MKKIYVVRRELYGHETINIKAFKDKKKAKKYAKSIEYTDYDATFFVEKVEFDEEE